MLKHFFKGFKGNLIFYVLLVLLIGIAWAWFTKPAGALKPWSKATLVRVVDKAARDYGISAKGRAWLKRSARDIVYTGEHPNILDKYERRESSGRHWISANGCAGLFQFTTVWKQTAVDKRRHKKYHKNYRHVTDWRKCPHCSTYRFVRVYKEGGTAKVKQHWKATLGK